MKYVYTSFLFGCCPSNVFFLLLFLFVFDFYFLYTNQSQIYIVLSNYILFAFNALNTHQILIMSWVFCTSLTDGSLFFQSLSLSLFVFPWRSVFASVFKYDACVLRNLIRVPYRSGILIIYVQISSNKYLKQKYDF